MFYKPAKSFAAAEPLSGSKPLKSLFQKNKKARQNCRAFAPPLGLEPRTCGLTVRRSNQLS